MGDTRPGDQSWVDELADRFERAWRAGDRPRIGDFLGDSAEPRRSMLVEELVRVERELRAAAGESPRAEEYRHLLPGHLAAIDAAFGAGSAPPRAGRDRPRVRAGRDLLFGLLALQNNFIDRDALLAAFATWVADKGRPLGRVLLDRGDLDADTHALLEALVKKHLAMHGDDPDRSLATLSSIGPARVGLEAVDDPDLQASLSRVSAAPESGEDSYATRVEGAGPAPPGGSRFRVLRFHKKGGQGQVSVARDEELHREVALKEIQDRYADDPHSRSRFVVEAEITGRLEHPGIIPVYGLGTYADGRPFYAMRFIKGDSLHEAIEQFHAGDGSGRNPGAHALALQNLLRRFLDVCYAMAYAHSRGVLHRDLKPQNIMLGPYGETLVVDWGLAKSVGRKDGSAGAGEATLRPESGSGDDATRAGSTIGTPAYMSPEQASGQLDRLGPASDVYGLGATLYCLLTGQPPFKDRDFDVVLEKVRLGEFPPPRSVDRTIDPALEAICLKAMARAPEGRYASARSLSDDIEHWLAGEPVTVFRDRWPARLARWARRNEWAVRTAVGAASLLLILAPLAVLDGRRRADDEARVARADTDRANAETARANDRVVQADQQAALAAKLGRYDQAQLARRDRKPGWTSAYLAALKDIAKGPPGLVGPADPRREIAACLSAVDLGPGQDFGDLLDFIHPPAEGLAFNRDGSRLVVAEGLPETLGISGGKLGLLSGRVVVFDPRDRKALFRLRWPSGRSPFSAALDALKLGNPRLERAGHPAISPDGRRVAIGTDTGDIHLWDLDVPNPDRGRVRWKAHDGAILGLAFGDDSGTLVSSADDRLVIRWQLLDPANAPPVPIAKVSCARPTGKLLARSGGSKFVAGSGGKLFELSGRDLTLGELGVDLLDYWPEVFDLSPDGESIAAVRNSGLDLIARDDDRRIRTLRDGNRDWDRPGTSALQFHPDGSLVLEECSSPWAVDHGVKLWEVATGRLVAELVIPGDGPINAMFTPDGRRLVLTEKRGGSWRLVSREVRPPRALTSLGRTAHPVRAATLAPDGQTLACLTDAWVPSIETGSKVHRVEASLWGVPAGERRGKRRFEGLYADASTDHHSITFRPDGKQIAFTGSHLEFFLWDPSEGGDARRVPAGGSYPYAAFSGDGRLWGLIRAQGLDGRRNGCVVLIKPGPPDLIETRSRADWSTLLLGSSGLSGIAAGRGVVLVGTSWGVVLVFREGKVPDDWSRSSWPIRADDPVNCVALSPDGKLAAVGTQSGEIHLRREPDGQVVGVVGRAHQRALTSLAFAPDGRMLASGSLDETARLWRLDGGVPHDPLTLPSPGGPVRSVAFTPDGAGLMMLVDGEHGVRVWALERLREGFQEMGLPW